MRIRSSRTLVFTPGDDGLVGINFLTRSVFGCPAGLIDLLPKRWTDFDKLVDGPFRGDTEAVNSLIENNAVVTAGSDLQRRENQYMRDWRWTVPAGLMHFSLEDADFMSLDESEAAQKAHLSEEPQPSLYARNLGRQAVVKLPAALGDRFLIDLMAKRRTVRTAAPQPITVAQLSDCLFAGLGITGFTTNSVGRLPLGMTPSGGARNPFEAYVFARSVDGLKPGVYHYSAFDHDLARLGRAAPPDFSSLLGGQTWADDMPCLIILCADFRRTMWKYDDANAYRVVLIEAGHIGQNIMLAATRHGLTACPTAALAHSSIRAALRLRRVTDAPTYAMTLGVPAPDAYADTDSTLN